MLYAIPHRILIDSGPRPVGKIFKAACVTMGTQLMTTTTYHPHTNGRKEGYNMTIIDRLCHYVSNHENDWDDYVGR